MNHVKGDMDDLFRRASEKYPLRTDSADWGRLAADLDNGSGMPSDIEAVEKRKRRGIFWWFLLLPLAGLGYLAWHASGHSNGTPTIPATVQTSAVGGGVATAATPASGETAKVASGTPQVASGAPQATSSTPQATSSTPQAKSSTPQAKSSTPQTTDAAPQGSGGVAKSSGTVPEQSGTRPGRTGGVPENSGSVPAGRDNALVAAPTGDNGQSDAGKGKPDAYKGKRNKNKLTGNGGKDRFDADNVGGTGDIAEMQKKTYLPVGKEQAAGKTPSLSPLDLRTVPTAGPYNLIVNVNAPATPQDNSRQPPKKAAAKSKSGHGYFGVIGAPDLSKVKFQSTKGVGTTLGVLLGYSFNDRWAIESGVYLDQKKYYSNAEYFSKEGYTAYPGNTLLNVNGTCKMLEIPLNLRYNFSKSERMKWFATAGFSTYLMFNENYTGNYEGTATGYVWSKPWGISKPSQYWFSIVNISAGFEQHIGKIGNLRIEPYLRLPLSGIGTGRLPIMSAGLNIGITHQLW
jgi:hypothetical protein